MVVKLAEWTVYFEEVMWVEKQETGWADKKAAMTAVWWIAVKAAKWVQSTVE